MFKVKLKYQILIYTDEIFILSVSFNDSTQSLHLSLYLSSEKITLCMFLNTYLQFQNK